MIKTKSVRKFIAVLANVSLLLNSFIPFLLAVKPAYAQDDVTPTPTLTEEIIEKTTPTETPTIIEVTPTLKPTVTPEFDVTPEITLALEVTVTSEVIPTVEPTIIPEVIITPQIIPTLEVNQGTITETQSSDNNLNNSLILEETPVIISPTCGLTPVVSQFSKQWTFEKVELNKEYIAPQNSQVKITFTKLPEKSGNIKIEEITLTPEQIKQTGSLSNKAYDITSDMPNGSFTYNLSLPIPIPSKGMSFSVKFSEEISELNSAQKVENSITKTDTSVLVNNLNHFTIFIISATLTTATLNNQSQVSVYPNESIKATLNIYLNFFSGWKYSKWKIWKTSETESNSSWNNVNTADHLSFGQYFSETFDIVNPNTPGTYNVSFEVCPFNETLNNCETINLYNAIIVNDLSDIITPVITLNGDNPLTLEIGTTYSEADAIVTDNIDVGLTASISGFVDTSTVGTYLRYYDAVDSSGNHAIQVTRTVNVVDTVSPILLNKTEFAPIWYNTDQISDFEYFDMVGITSGAPVSCQIFTEGFNQICSVMPNVCDAAGNCNTQTVISNGVNIDKTNPIIDVSINPSTPDDSNGWYKTQPEISLTLTELNPETFEYQWDSKEAGLWVTYLAPIKPSTEGTHTLYFQAIDLAGNSFEDSIEVKWDKNDTEDDTQNESEDDDESTTTSNNTENSIITSDQPAEVFSPQVLGETTKNIPILTISPNQNIEEANVLGATSQQKCGWLGWKCWWWLLLIIPVYPIGKKIFNDKKKK